MNAKSLRRQVKGSGTIRARKIIISVTKRRKTCTQNNSKHGGHIASVVVGETQGTRAVTMTYCHWHPHRLSLPVEHTRDGSSTYQTVVERHFDCVVVVALRCKLIFVCLGGVGQEQHLRQNRSGLTKMVVEWVGEKLGGYGRGVRGTISKRCRKWERRRDLDRSHS
jgi:hypothetical protein